MKIIKKKNSDISETIITIEYFKWNSELEEIIGFIEGKKETISGYDDVKEIHSVHVADILYFEAVGEHVFAYTKDDIFEIKMRLYQVEESIVKNKFFRASKSILMNIKKVASLKSALNGRLVATMDNGEEIMISRSYAKAISAYLKSM